MSARRTIAERELLYSLKGERDRRKLVIRISAPYLVDKEAVKFDFDHGAAGCAIEFGGLPEDSIDVFGIDPIHALTLAVDIDSYLQGMRKKYDFFWSSGEPYFDDKGS